MKNPSGTQEQTLDAIATHATSLDAHHHVQFSSPSWAAVGDLTKWVGKNAASGIVGAAAGMLFQEFLGAVGLGGPDMAGKLDQISQQLTDVQRSLDRISAMTAQVLQEFNELRVFMEKSLKVDTLLTAMASIEVAYGRQGESLLHGDGVLGESSTGRAISLRLLTEKMPHFEGVTPAYLTAAAHEFASYVADVPGRVDTIRRMLVQDAFGQLSLLQHWARELTQQLRAKKISRESAYLVLEGYFLQAVSIQLKGLCVHGVALSTDPLAPQLIKQYLEEDFAALMREQTSTFLAAVDDILFATLDPIVPIGPKKMDDREFPQEIDGILLRADLLCAALNLIGWKPDGALAASPQAAIQGIYGRSLLRPSDLKDGKAPAMDLDGYQAAPAGAQHKLPYHCLDLIAPDGKATLSDVATSMAVMARHHWRFPTPIPAPGKPIDTRFRGSVTPALYPVFGLDQPMVLAAGVLNGAPLFRGLPASVKQDTVPVPFPSGNPHVTFFNQLLTCNKHALATEPATIFQSSFEVQNAWRAFSHEISHVRQRLFGYAGKTVKLRLWANLTNRLQMNPRLDYSKPINLHQYQIQNELRLRLPNGTEKEFYNTSTAFNGDLGCNRPSANAVAFAVDRERSGHFFVEFDLVPGEYHLVLNNVCSFPPCPINYSGWQSTKLNFNLHIITLEMIFPPA